MRRRSVVAIAALIAAFALAGVPAPAGSRTPSTAAAPAPVAFSNVTVPADPQARGGEGLADAVMRSEGYLDPATALGEPGVAVALPSSRPRADQPPGPSGEAWKAPRQTLHGQATFYDNGTTAMRLPRGTVVRICGGGGCIERVVNDYGPQKQSRVVDLYRPDFFAICGCGSWSGVTTVTVYVY
ncbi:MAG TPA: hypothetical protein VGK16_14715 [Candidatus Limnocylindrales bacterium]